MATAQNNVDVDKTASLAGALRNPLVVFGLIILAGDGPLILAYALAQDATQKWVLLASLVIFVFSMGAIFSYLVLFKPRHLYAPNEIPKEAFERSIYQDPEPVKRILRDAKTIAEDIKGATNEKERDSLSHDLAQKIQVVDQLQKAYDLLLIPGYDLSLILDILESIDRTGSINPEAIAHARNITPSTVVVITNSMNSRGMLEPQGSRLTLTDQGKKMLTSLRKHMRPLSTS